jgi:hypothetical protein
MGQLVKVIVVLDYEQTREFISTKKMDGVDTLPEMHPRIKNCVKQFIADNTGYDNVPIAGLSQYNGNPGELKKIDGANVNEFFPLRSNNVLWELHMPDDMACSVSFADLLNYSRFVEEAEDEFEIEGYLEDFNSKISLGYPKDSDEDMLSFIPFIDLNKCKFYGLVSQTWGISEGLNVPGVEQVPMKTLNLF